MNLDETKDPQQDQLPEGDRVEAESATAEESLPFSQKPAGSWTPEEIALLAEWLLRGKSLPEAVEAAFKDHPDLKKGVIEAIEDQKLKG